MDEERWKEGLLTEGDRSECSLVTQLVSFFLCVAFLLELVSTVSDESDRGDKDCYEKDLMKKAR